MRQNFAESGDPRGHRHGIGVVSAAMKDFVIGDQAHHSRAGRESRQRKAAADGFRQANDVRLDPEIFARAAAGQFRAGFHFVENQQRAIFPGDFAQRLVVALVGHQDAHVHHDRLDDHRRDFAGIFGEQTLDAGEIVELRDQRICTVAFGMPAPPGTDVGDFGSPISLALGFTRDEH